MSGEFPVVNEQMEVDAAPLGENGQVEQPKQVIKPISESSRLLRSTASSRRGGTALVRDPASRKRTMESRIPQRQVRPRPATAKPKTPAAKRARTAEPAQENKAPIAAASKPAGQPFDPAHPESVVNEKVFKLGAKYKKNGDFDKKFAESKTYITRLRTEYVSLNNKYDQIAESSDASGVVVDQMKSDLEASQTKCGELTASVATKEGEITSLQTQLADQGVTLADTQQEVIAKSAELESANNTIAENATIIAEAEKIQSELKGQLEDKTNECEEKAGTIAELQATITEKLAEIAQLEEQARADEKLRKKLHNTIQELKGNIRVFCRLRPVLGAEVTAEAECTPPYGYPNDPNSKGRALTLTADNVATAPGRAPESRAWNFNFDKVFGPDSSQANVFEEISQLVQSALDGYKVCIFAYGQTGSGKTFTMEGGDSVESQGMIPRSVLQIFESIEQAKELGWEYKIEASYLEIYNEKITDLSTPASDLSTHDLRVGKKGAPYVEGLNKVEVNSIADVNAVLDKAQQKRRTAATNSNERSSRSHSVFQLYLSGHNTLTGEPDTEGLLNLIDLAGSERIKASGATGDRLKETQAINKSLAALGDVIASLANNDKHIPYRNSKLTHLLQQSLGAEAKTLMFVNINPTTTSIPESLCSLRFASKVNACEIGTARKGGRIKLN